MCFASTHGYTPTWAKALTRAAVIVVMLLTMHLSVTETLNYAALRTELRRTARTLASKRGSRFAQLVAADGRILDILEVRK